MKLRNNSLFITPMVLIFIAVSLSSFSLLILYLPKVYAAGDCTTAKAAIKSFATETVDNKTFLIKGQVENCINHDNALNQVAGLRLFGVDSENNPMTAGIKTGATGEFSLPTITFPSAGKWTLTLQTEGFDITKGAPGIPTSLEITTVKTDLLACGAETNIPNDTRCPKECGAVAQGLNRWYCGAPDGAFKSSVQLIVRIKPGTKDTYIINRADVNVVGGTNSGGGGTIDPKSTTLVGIFQEAAGIYGIPTAILMAVNKLETGVIDRWTDADLQKFSAPNWWEKVTPEEFRAGYAYNTCGDPAKGCFEGADVRGIMQFELRTWNGVTKNLTFLDEHTAKREYPKDSIFAAGIYIQDIGKKYDEQFGTSPNPTNWSDDKAGKVGLYYCHGNFNPANKDDKACTGGGDTYDIIVTRYYQQYKAKGY